MKITSILAMVILIPTLLISLSGCKDNADYAAQVEREQYHAKKRELTEIIENTSFETDMPQFENMTFGEVVNELIEADPEENDVTYMINERIPKFDMLKSGLENFDMDKYDYICAYLGFNIVDHYEYGSIVFSVDKITKDVEPVAQSANGDELETNNKELIIDSWYLMISVAAYMK